MILAAGTAEDNRVTAGDGSRRRQLCIHEAAKHSAPRSTAWTEPCLRKRSPIRRSTPPDRLHQVASVDLRSQGPSPVSSLPQILPPEAVQHARTTRGDIPGPKQAACARAGPSGRAAARRGRAGGWARPGAGGGRRLCSGGSDAPSCRRSGVRSGASGRRCGCALPAWPQRHGRPCRRRRRTRNPSRPAGRRRSGFHSPDWRSE